jgi:hypothetical protein
MKPSEAAAFLKRVPWDKFLLLWFLAVLMGTSLLWLHYGFTGKIAGPMVWLAGGSGLGLLWGTTRPRWEKAHCSWCGFRVQAQSMRFDDARAGWVLRYVCAKCGQATEKFKARKGT